MPREIEVRPSGAPIWHYCQGGPELQRYYPNDSGEAAEIGEAAHWVASECLIKKTYNPLAYLGTTTPNGVYVDQEMVDGVEEYIMEIMTYCQKYGLVSELHIEEKMSIAAIYPTMVGTPDCWVYNPQVPEMVNWDFKYGHGYVEVYRNPQFICYDAAILDKLKIDGIADQTLVVSNRVVQPRSYNGDKGTVREWCITASDLRPFINQVKMSAAIAMDGTGVCTPGLHCNHCTGKPGCEALQQTSQDIMDRTGMPTPVDLKTGELGFEYKLLSRAAKIINYRLESIEAQVESELRSGKSVPGYAVQDTYGRKKWKKDIPTDQVIMMGDLMGIDIRKPQMLDTPAQVIKKLKSDDVVKQYIERPHNGWKVIEDDGSKARLAFAKK